MAENNEIVTEDQAWQDVRRYGLALILQVVGLVFILASLWLTLQGAWFFYLFLKIWR